TEDFIKDPYVLEFLDLKNYPALRESDLEQALIDKLQEFLLELGRGFCFVARQKLMRYEDEDFYLDLVFYHSILKCHVLIDLKVGKLTHGDIGQMDSYIRMFDALYRNDDDNPTIGIILCSQKNEARVSKIYGGFPVVNIYEIDDDFRELSDLRIKDFGAHTTEEWAKFIMNNRNRTFTDEKSLLCNRDNKYDIVIGPVADDNMALLFRQYENEIIDFSTLLKGMIYRKT